MVKTFKLFLILLLLHCRAYSQDSIKEIEFSISSNSPKIYYEGQCVFFTTCLKNLSNKKRPNIKNPSIRIIEFSSEQGELITNAHWTKEEEQNNQDLFKVNHPKERNSRMPPNSIDERSFYLYSWGNTDFLKMLNVPDSIYGSRYPAVAPHYLKPGRYKIKLVAIINKVKRLTVTAVHTFEVLPALGEERKQMIAYLEAFKKDIDSFYFDKNEKSDSLQLVKFLHENETSIYATEAFRLLTIEAFYVPWSFDSFRHSHNIFSMFEMLPLIDNYKSDNIAEGFLNLYTLNLGSFQQRGAIKDIRAYVDSYLKRLVNYSPLVSDTMIAEVKSYFKITGFRNYAREKERGIK